MTTAKETRSKITPYAFAVEPSLLEIPLAAPWQRLFAMLLDLSLIAIAAETLSSWGLALLLLTLWYTRKNNNRKVHALLWSGLIILFVSHLIWTTTEEDRQELKQSVGLFNIVPESISLQACETTECIHLKSKEIQEKLAEADLPEADQHEVLSEVLDPTHLSSSEQKALLASLFPEETAAPTRVTTTSTEEPETLSEIEREAEAQISSDSEEITPFALLKGLLRDLGLSFGWAVGYFTFFTVWHNGQTPAKQLFRIKVIRLNGKPMTLWDSFGRYGGYAAGLVTGMMGFLQIFWDPNRQAIQDKISGTAVIKVQPIPKVIGVADTPATSSKKGIN